MKNVLCYADTLQDLKFVIFYDFKLTYSNIIYSMHAKLRCKGTTKMGHMQIKIEKL